MVVSGIAWLMQFTMETTAIESLNAACNIFVGMVCLNALVKVKEFAERGGAGGLLRFRQPPAGL